MNVPIVFYPVWTRMKDSFRSRLERKTETDYGRNFELKLGEEFRVWGFGLRATDISSILQAVHQMLGESLGGRT